MTQARLVPVDVPGLNLLLGGGVPVLARHRESEESAVLLVRGPPGSGKTVLGTQLAGALARALVPDKMMDVAYGCVELLPVELAAQHAGLTPTDLPERVIIPQFPVDVPEPHTGSECRIYADLLDLQPDEEQAGVEAAIERLLDLTARAGGKPRVVVVDSLSDGYNLGSHAPRVLADALSKLAVARGMVFILLEETIDGRPSHWSFAADLVMELGQPTTHGPESRTKSINITKNRFGRAEAGPHQASIGRSGRYTIRPEPSAYASGFWNPLQMVRGTGSEREWGEPHLDAPANKWPRLLDQTVAVIGTNPTEVRRLAYSLGRPRKDEIELSVNISDAENEPANLNIYDPYVNGAQLLSFIVGYLQKVASRVSLARIIMGDARSLRIFPAREDVIRSLMILSTLLHEAKVPLILFDSSASRIFGRAPAGSELPLVANFADVQIVGWAPDHIRSHVTASQGGSHRIQWDAEL